MVLHLGFIIFVAGGGFLALRWHRVAWIHLPVLVWGVLISFFHFRCPLTDLELWLRENGPGEYSGSFIEHYVTPIVYPADVGPTYFTKLGIGLILLNIVLYAIVLRRSNLNLYDWSSEEQ